MKHVTQQEYIITISPLENVFIAHFSSIGGALTTMTSHYLYATLQAHLTNVNGNGQILFYSIITDTFGHVHFCIKQVETRFKRGNKMVATEGREESRGTSYPRCTPL